jgi:putative acetyltransferase
MNENKTNARHFHIRRSQPQDMFFIGDIWLKGSLLAHDFISGDYWRGELATMCDIYFPDCELWVLIDDKDIILGFIALHDDELSALFIDSAAQGQGLGGLLLNHAQRLRPDLWLVVYDKNKNAQNFYEHHGYTKSELQTCENTGFDEWLMRRSPEPANGII